MKHILIFVAMLCLFHDAFATDEAKPLLSRHRNKKKLILAGQGNRYPQQVRDQIHEISQHGFDGIVFRMKWPDPSIDIFYDSPVSECDLELDSLRSIKWNDTLTDNFIRFTAGRANVPNWFDDSEFNIYVENIKKISYAVAVSGAKGIFLDVEPYANTSWMYNSTLYPTATLDSVKAVLRKRGKQIIEALQAYKPDIKLYFVPATYSHLS